MRHFPKVHKWNESTLGDDWPSIVMSHNVFRTNHNIVARLDDFAVRKTNSILLDDFFDDSLGYVRTVWGYRSQISDRVCSSAVSNQR